MATGSGSVPAIEGSNRAKDPWTIEQTIFVVMGGSPGLVVKRKRLISEGWKFESRHLILEGSYFTLICCKSVLFV